MFFFDIFSISYVYRFYKKKLNILICLKIGELTTSKLLYTLKEISSNKQIIS